MPAFAGMTALMDSRVSSFQHKRESRKHHLTYNALVLQRLTWTQNLISRVAPGPEMTPVSVHGTESRATCDACIGTWGRQRYLRILRCDMLSAVCNHVQEESYERRRKSGTHACQ